MGLLARLFGRTPAPVIDLDAPAFARDPFPKYEALRSGGSVHFLPHHNAWLVLGYDDVQFAFAHPELFSNRPYRDLDAVLLGADPPDHTRVRRLVSRQFSPEAVGRLAAYAEELAASLVRPEMEIVADYATVLSDAVAARLLGFADDESESRRFAIAAAKASAGTFEGFVAALRRIVENGTLYESLRADGLDESAARSLAALLWLASTETTQRLIARCTLRLLQHPEVRDAVTRDAELVPAFVEEVLRLHPPENIIMRVANADTRLGAAMIPAGALLYLALAAANRDPAKFDAAAAIRLDRRGERPLSFGHGIHHCVGATLGRRVIAAAVKTLLARAPHFRAVTPLEEIVYTSSRTSDVIARLVIATAPPS
jgi:cytochrome P450